MALETLHKFQSNPIYKHMDIKRVLETEYDLMNPTSPPQTSTVIDIGITPIKIHRDMFAEKIHKFNALQSEYGHFFKKKNMIGDLTLLEHSNWIKALSFSNKNKKQERIDVAYVADETAIDQLFSVYIEVEPYCTAMVTENFYNDADLKIHKIVYVLREGSTLDIVRNINVQGAHETVQVIESEFVQHPNSTLKMYTRDGIQGYLQDLYFVDATQSTVTDIKCRYNAKADNSVHVVTDVNHQGKDCSTNVDVKSVTDDDSKFTFSGNLNVDKKAEGADAHLKNKNLQLVDTATVITEPKLDIRTKEIACTHGCTVSSIDEDQLYLLNTKGINNNTAKQLLTEAFLNG